MDARMTLGHDVQYYSRPSVDIERHDGAEWQWGVTHTVSAENLAPILPGVEYSRQRFIRIAVVMLGVMRFAQGQALPSGQPSPAAEELVTTGGATMEEMQRRSPQRATEVLVEFDHREGVAGEAPPFTYSYGERVTADIIDTFEPFVRRAESEARAHQAQFHFPPRPGTPLAHVQRAWYMADRLVTVELHLHGVGTEA